MARKWVDALRSGKYKQTTEGLLSKTEVDGTKSYCCLGVLREIQGGLPYCHEATASLLPEHACGLSGREMGQLADLNDGTGSDGKSHSFAEIADIIEESYLK
jgi:hypothetical protein